MRRASAILGILFASLVGQTAFANNGIQMLPPQDFSGNPCSSQNNTGGMLYWDGASAVKCVPGMAGSANGYVGIAQLPGQSPQTALDVSEALQVITTSAPDNNYWLQINGGVDGSTHAALGLSGGTSNNGWLDIKARGPDGDINFYAGGSPAQTVASNLAMTIRGASGYVGIGTIQPGAALDIDDANTTQDMLDVRSPTGGNFAVFPNPFTTYTNYWPAVTGGADGVHNAVFSLAGTSNNGWLEIHARGSAGGLLFFAGGTNQEPAENMVMSITPDTHISPTSYGGYVGIGTVNPGATLDILSPDTGLWPNNEPTNWGTMLFRAMDNMSRAAVIVYGNIDGTPLADNTQGALAVSNVVGTGRSITTSGSIYIGGTQGTALPNSLTGTSIMTVGQVAIGTPNTNGYMLYVNGTAYAVGAAGALSDRRHKKDIEAYADDALAQVEQLKPVTFLWKDPKDDGMKGKQIGFIAQDVQTVVPDAVMTMNNEEKTLSLRYDALIPVLTKSIQQLKSEVDAQSREIENEPQARLDVGSGAVAMGYQVVTNECDSAQRCVATCPAGKHILSGGCDGDVVRTGMLTTNTPECDTSTWQWTCAYTKSIARIVTTAICANISPYEAGSSPYCPGYPN